MNSQTMSAGTKIAASTHGLYYASRLMSQAGQGMFFAFLVVAAGPTTEGALGLGSSMVAMTVAAITLGPVGGWIVDRLGARVALGAGAVLRLGAVASGLLVLGFGEYAWIVAFIYSAASQVFSPAELALVATLGGKRPAGTHASLFALQFGGQAVGGLVLGPLLFVLAGTGGMLGGAIVAYVLVTALAGLLALRLRGVLTAESHERSALHFGRALRFFGAEPRALYAVGMLAFFDVMIKALVVTAPIFLKTELELGRAQLVMLVATGVVGALVGLAWAARHRTSERTVESMRWALAAPLLGLFALAPVGDGLATLTVRGASVNLGGVGPEFLIGTFAALPAMFVLGASLSVAPVIARSVLTATAPLGQQGRVFAAEGILSSVLVIPGLLAASLATDLISARATVIAIAVLGALVFVALEFAATKRWAPLQRGEGVRPLVDASRSVAVPVTSD